MRVHIGPYVKWWGPYQVADLLQYVGVSKDTCHDLGEKLSNTWVDNFLQWVHDKQKRKVKIHIDNYDVWSADYTLALIILPLLERLKAIQQGSPMVDDADVPEGLGLRSTEAPAKESEWDADDNFHKRWEWVLSELIWTFTQVADDASEDKFYTHTPMSEEEIAQLDPGSLDFIAKAHITIDRDGLNAHNERIANGLRLFGKYYQGLWD